MKISQLIRKLEKVKKEHGDLEVLYEDRYEREYLHCALHKFTNDDYDLTFKVEDYKQNENGIFEKCDKFLLIEY